jgi:hypothetical protein
MPKYDVYYATKKGGVRKYRGVCNAPNMAAARRKYAKKGRYNLTFVKHR